MLMIVFDSTIVNVALPSIRADLGFSESSLAWLVNAYLLAYGGFLLLGGRMGDLYGPRTVFIIGTAIFTLASLACGAATSLALLIIARAMQGVGGAVVSAVTLSLILNMFSDQEERAKALGVTGLVCSGGGSIGVLLGGLLTSTLSWHWIFFVNLPVGVAVCFLCLYLIPGKSESSSGERLDIAGAITVTTALMLGVYVILNGHNAGWTSKQSVGPLSVAVGLFLIFLIIESRVRAPLVPLSLFRSRAISVSNIVAVLWATGLFSWGFTAALYLQRILGYDSLHVALVFLPANVVMAVLALCLSAKLVIRFGVNAPLAIGLLLCALGLALFTTARLNATLLSDVYPGMLLLGIGTGIASNPLLIASTSGVDSSKSGLVSGLVNTSSMMGGAVGLAILASAASAHTAHLLRQGIPEMAALNAGYHLAFAMGSVACTVAAILSITLLPSGKRGEVQLEEGVGTTQ